MLLLDSLFGAQGLAYGQLLGEFVTMCISLAVFSQTLRRMEEKFFGASC